MQFALLWVTDYLNQNRLIQFFDPVKEGASHGKANNINKVRNILVPQDLFELFSLKANKDTELTFSPLAPSDPGSPCQNIQKHNSQGSELDSTHPDKAHLL